MTAGKQAGAKMLTFFTTAKPFRHRRALGFHECFRKQELRGATAKLGLQKGWRRGPEWIDYFVFTRGLYRAGLPPFVVGRVFWDTAAPIASRLTQ